MQVLEVFVAFILFTLGVIGLSLSLNMLFSTSVTCSSNVAVPMGSMSGILMGYAAYLAYRALYDPEPWSFATWDAVFLLLLAVIDGFLTYEVNLANINSCDKMLYDFSYFMLVAVWVWVGSSLTYIAVTMSMKQMANRT